MVEFKKPEDLNFKVGKVGIKFNIFGTGYIYIKRDPWLDEVFAEYDYHKDSYDFIIETLKKINEAVKDIEDVDEAVKIAKKILREEQEKWEKENPDKFSPPIFYS